MNKALFAALVASTFGLSALSAVAADLTNEERTELRTRAERLQAERLQNPRASDVRLDQNRSDVKLRPRGDVKVKSAKVKKAKRPHARKAHMKESLKKVPGALVRKDR